MFGKQPNRVARRQRVLEELLWLEPVDRERRIIAAVASGEFSAEEMDSALRLVSRLDSLRTTSFPPGGRLVGGRVGLVVTQPEPGHDAGVLAARSSSPDGRDGRDSLAHGGSGEPLPVPAIERVSEPSLADGRDGVSEPVGIPIVPDAFAPPVDAFEPQGDAFAPPTDVFAPSADTELIGVPVSPELIGIPIAPDDEGR